jgi:hypothetical protein
MRSDCLSSDDSLVSLSSRRLLSLALAGSSKRMGDICTTVGTVEFLGLLLLDEEWGSVGEDCEC